MREEGTEREGEKRRPMASEQGGKRLTRTSDVDRGIRKSAKRPQGPHSERERESVLAVFRYCCLIKFVSSFVNP